MSEQKVWSLSLGRWGAVQVRLHMFFLLFAAFTAYLSWRYAAAYQDRTWLWLGAVSLLILLVSVLFHELGHHWTATRLGGGADQLVLGPLGGLTPIRVPFEPRRELLAILAGPFVNLIVALVCLLGLQFLGREQVETWAAAIFGQLNPLRPPFLLDDAGLGQTIGLATCLALTLWINWGLFLLNLLPAFPFDGGRALLVFLSIVRHNVGSRRPVVIVALIAKLVAVGLLVAAWFVRDPPADGPAPIVPTWFPLVLVSIFLFFSARLEESQQELDESDDELFGYDFSQGYTSLERQESPTSKRRPIVRWLKRRREQRLTLKRAREAEEDRKMDEILARLHETGIENLSPADRALLNRVSARYRSRPRS